MLPADEPPDADGSRVLVYNPVSGTGDHGERIRSLAAEYDFAVRETESAEDIVDTAAAAAREASVVGAAGGDGTLTRAVRGLDRAGALEETLFAVVPTGTGNNFAGNVGIESPRAGFEAVDGGRRRIDVGIVDGTPFLNSCVVGLTAEASAETDSEAKERWGTIAYALTTARTLTEFDGLELRVDPEEAASRVIEASVVLVGNGRRFDPGTRGQADMEDGLLEVTVVEDVSLLAMIEDSIEQALGMDADGIQRFTTPDLEIDLRGTPDSVSVDGEIVTTRSLSLAVRNRALHLAVGPAYDPDPGPWG